jgi:NADPH-dependent glutamate synthase beta subunit-like oxidoreductase/Pyruvate/2-oxoacid:ferredoxin oxidoreductase delta subunit
MTAEPSPEPATGRTYRRYRIGDDRYASWQEEIFKAGGSHKCPTYVLRASPCQAACPSGHDIRGWLSIIRGLDKPVNGLRWQEYAFRRMTAANPFPAIMGRVCPSPCEDACNRNELEDHVGINSVEHFIGDWALAEGLRFPAPERETGRRVAVVGGGPAGLSAAYHLRRRGHQVVLYDDHVALGGMVRYGIPGYRTPREVLDGEIQRILDLGVVVHLNTRVGRDLSIDALQRESDAVFWALGSHQGRQLTIPGGDATNCITGVAFLRAFNEGRLKSVSGQVVVIGGGDTSLDVASVARRLGHVTQAHDKDRPASAMFGQVAHDVATTARREGADVILTSLFPVDRMFAAKREIEDALREGVDIRGGIMPLEVGKDSEGRVRSLKVCRCEMNGMEPIPVAGTEQELPCQLLVVAIGQKADLGDLAELDNGSGFIGADRRMCVAGRRGHFAGGDVVRPHFMTMAIGHGRIAAESIDAFVDGIEPRSRARVDGIRFDLGERLRQVGKLADTVREPVRGTATGDFAIHNFEDRAASDIVTHEDLFLGHFPYQPRHVRRHRPLGADEVLGDFQERLFALSEEETVAEAGRCMSCGLCFQCDNCVVYCPQHAVGRVPLKERVLGHYVRTDYSRCIGCHVCHDVCPTGYIRMGLGEG